MAKHSNVLKQKKRYEEVLAKSPDDWSGDDINFISDYQNALQLEDYKNLFNALRQSTPVKHRRELTKIRDEFIKVLQKKYDFTQKVFPRRINEI